MVIKCTKYVGFSSGFEQKNKTRFVVFKFVVEFLVICPFCLVIIDTSPSEQCAVAINISVSHSLITFLLYRCPEIGDTVIKNLFWTSEHNRTNKCLKCIHASFEDIEISSLFPLVWTQTNTCCLCPYMRNRSGCNTGWLSGKGKLLLLLKSFFFFFVSCGLCHPVHPRKTTE